MLSCDALEHTHSIPTWRRAPWNADHWAPDPEFLIQGSGAGPKQSLLQQVMLTS